jgi:methionine-rich copper-binding protein CopC
VRRRRWAAGRQGSPATEITQIVQEDTIMDSIVGAARPPIAKLAFALLFAATLFLFGTRHGVSAHAAFVWGTPNDGDVISALPSQIDAHFAEDIVKQAGTYGLAVYDSAGDEVDNQDTVLDDNDRRHMTVTLQSGVGADTYTVKWWTVSDEDGDAANGTYSFTVTGS